MNFVSYAQNFEDIMLWRALKNVEHGFYIDIGANDPIVDSVSMAFYEQGWRGVHVEPTEQYAVRLKQARPDEIVEQVAVGDFPGPLVFYEFEDTGLSTLDPEIAKRHLASGFEITERETEVISLDVILDRYGERDVHWLKIDVEGFEKSVLESWRLSATRPWILIIESTKPLTHEQTFDEWEGIVLAKGYNFAYFDGLNRFYVHHEHSELLPFFYCPPNVFDEFALSGTATHSFYCFAVAQAQARARHAEGKALQAEAKAQQLEAELQAVFSSSSWRLTAPLRWFKGLFRRRIVL